MNTLDRDACRLIAKSSDDDRSGHRHRLLIGSIGLVLPILLWLIAGWRPTEGLPRWQPLSSISAYYYTEAVSAFAAGLVALAVFLFSYRGYDNEYGRHDRVAANIAGCAAVLAAFFPTNVPNGLPAPSWWTPLLGWIHYSSAAVLFGSFIYFSLVLFPKSGEDKERIPRDKRRRNRIYILCGLAIVFCMAWAVVASVVGAPIFWAETLALEFFAVSWLVKGRADWTLAAAGRRTLYYGQHPRQWVDDVRSAIRGVRGAGAEAPREEA